MNITFSEQKELRHMRDNIRRSVNALEVCGGCQRVCECESSLLNETVPLWLCSECLLQFEFRLEEQSGVPVSITA